MGRYFREEPAREGVGESPPTETWIFAQAVLGKPVPLPYAAEAEARAKREKLEWAAQYLPEAQRELRALLQEEAAARARAIGMDGQVFSKIQTRIA